MDWVVWNLVIIISKMKLNLFDLYKVLKIDNDELKFKLNYIVIYF